MQALKHDLDKIIQQFVDQVTQIARGAAVRALEAAMHAGIGRPGPASAGLASRTSATPDQPRRGKRTPQDMEALAQRFLAFVSTNPGLRIEQINKQIQTTTRDLALPIRKLLIAGRIRVVGEKRSTTYFPVTETGQASESVAGDKQPAKRGKSKKSAGKKSAGKKGASKKSAGK